jgi:ABC-type antimicrobial peptide transport system permease subunit
VLELKTMEEVKQSTLSQRRHASGVAMAFGAAGVFLALCGVYALVSFVVARERRDIGVRLALGATGAGVVWVVVRRLLTLGAVGILAGTAAAALIEPPIVAALKAQPTSFWLPAAAIAVVLLSAAALAAWVPARRVLSIDPLRVLGD